MSDNASFDDLNTVLSEPADATPRPPHLYNWNDIPRQPVRRGIERCAVGGENVLCQFGWIEPGAELRPHQHTFEQVVMILEGECVYHVGGVPHPCVRGSIIRVPPNTEHYIEATGTQTVLNLDIFAPVREDIKYLLDHQKAEWGQ